ncbi:MNIO family bufferin maturase [Cognatishimia activa]|uniref:DUF692 domain-containing protein n=1 Tax=Cognatishimia activa TaxID=1715691 RepID=A0A975EQ08_9RHOB|nr:DUF692 domain-containing protein [Cognatishimia activa]QTN36075.1 DUF692 domain-containing protein [Cognatishimia activa]
MFDQSFEHLPQGCGVGYKPQHFADIMENAGSVSWFEIHAENYMGDGGRPLAQLRHLAERYAMSVHGVGLSIGGEGDLDQDHLNRLKHLVGWLNPASFSEHLAWSTHETHFLNDLLPLPYNAKTVQRVSSHISQVQETVGRQMLLENPSNYLAFSDSDMSEIDFLKEVANRSGCGLLLDVNNVFVSATNQKMNAVEYIDAFPLDLVGEIHLGGHDEDVDDHGDPLLIDSHDQPVVNQVWSLFAHTILRGGKKPVLIERDGNIPPWDELESEAAQALDIMTNVKAAA